MKEFKYLKNILPILYPKFYTLYNSEKYELVFLDIGEKLEANCIDKLTGLPFADYLGLDKTQCEAIQNQFHIFKKISKNKKIEAVKIGKIIALNLLDRLSAEFQDKSFVVYLEVNPRDTTIIRFHQLWNNEPIYIDIHARYSNDVELFEFRSKNLL